MEKKWDRDLTDEESKKSRVIVFDAEHSYVRYKFENILAGWKKEEKQMSNEKFGRFDIYKIEFVANNKSTFDG